MNTAVKERLIAELRGGKHTQATEALKEVRPDGTCAYCTLGLLIELALDAGVPLHWVPESSTPGDIRRVPCDQAQRDVPSDRLPSAVAQWAQLTETPRISLQSVSTAHIQVLNDYLLTLHMPAHGVFEPLSPQDEMFIHELNDMGVPFSLQADILDEAL